MFDTSNFKDFASFLNWVMTGGGIVLMAWGFSWAIEKLGFWKDMKAWVKSLIVLGVSALLGIGAYQVSLNPAIVAAVEPYFKIIVAVVGVWLSTQVAHEKDPSRKE